MRTWRSGLTLSVLCISAVLSLGASAGSGKPPAGDPAPDGGSGYRLLGGMEGPAGVRPVAGLALAPDGTLFGANSQGGPKSHGAIFKIKPPGAVELVHSFEGSDGDVPLGTPLLASDGNLYGTTYDGGTENSGVVYRMTPAGDLSVLHSFVSATDGAAPVGELMQAADGRLYGTTQDGGPATGGGGTIFSLGLSGDFQVMHAFAAPDPAGIQPQAGLVQDAQGNFYGTTSDGGGPTGKRKGTVFRMTPSGEVTALHVFQGGAEDGRAPRCTLLLLDGKLFGTTEYGGPGRGVGDGTVFSMALGGKFEILHFFEVAEGFSPMSGLVRGTTGWLYGTTVGGGSGFTGTVYRITPKGKYQVLYMFGFDGGGDGTYPYAALTLGPEGKLYGTTSNGGGWGGAVFRIGE